MSAAIIAGVVVLGGLIGMILLVRREAKRDLNEMREHLERALADTDRRTRANHVDLLRAGLAKTHDSGRPVRPAAGRS